MKEEKISVLKSLHPFSPYNTLLNWYTAPPPKVNHVLSRSLKLAENFKCKFKCKWCKWEGRKRPLINNHVSVEVTDGLTKTRCLTYFWRRKKRSKYQVRWQLTKSHQRDLKQGSCLRSSCVLLHVIPPLDKMQLAGRQLLSGWNRKGIFLSPLFAPQGWVKW